MLTSILNPLAPSVLSPTEVEDSEETSSMGMAGREKEPEQVHVSMY